MLRKLNSLMRQDLYFLICCFIVATCGAINIYLNNTHGVELAVLELLFLSLLNQSMKGNDR